jgi:GNAT superfamily N-acetyltransferase
MNVTLRQATAADLDFARELTRVNMRRYYVEFGCVWHGELFDDEWKTRQSFVILKTNKRIGFFSVSLESLYLYLRDIQLCEPYRGEGVGGWVMNQIASMTYEHGFKCVRLKVFKSNPAIALYLRHKYTVVGAEDALLWMERVLND